MLRACLRTEMKILDKRRSSPLAGMFSIALDPFSDSQNFFHAFKSLLVFSWVLFDFCSCKNFSISTSSLLVTSASRKIDNVFRFLYVLPREGLLILPFSIMKRNKRIFSYSLFLTIGLDGKIWTASNIDFNQSNAGMREFGNSQSLWGTKWISSL